MKTIISIILWPLWFLYFSLTILILFALFYIIPKRYLYLLIRPLCWSWCFFAGQWLVKVGKVPSEKNQPYLYMFNHSSMFDQFMIGAFLPHYITAVAAIEVFNYPIFGLLMKKYGIIPIVRKNIKKALRSLSKAESALNNEISFLISPEGTRSLTGEIGDFKKGPFHLSKNTGATIIPVGLIGAFNAKKKSDWRLTPGKLIIKFGDPIRSTQFKGMTVEELRDLVKLKIKKLIDLGD